MANIREESAPQGLGLNPTEMGVDARLQVARRGGAFYNQVAEAKSQTGQRVASTIKDVGDVVISHVDQRDRGDISAAATGTLATLDQAWSTKTKGNGLDKSDPNYIPPSDPRDPTLAAKFMEEQVQPALDKLNDIPIGENGHKYAQEKIDQIRNHLSEKFTADMSTMAGEAAVLQDRQTTNNLSNLVTTSPDFHSVDMALQMHKEAAAGWRSNPNVSGVQAGKLDEHFQASQEQIVHAAASAAISKSSNPEATAAAFSKRYPDYIKGDVVNQFAKAATTQNKVNRLTQQSIENNEIKEKERAAATQLSNTFSSKVSYDNNGKATIKPGYFDEIMQTVRSKPGAGDETARALINFGQHQLQEKRDTVNTNREKQSDLLSRMNDPNNPTTETQILEAATRDELDDRARNNLMALRKATDEAPNHDPVYTATLDAAKNIIMQSFEGNENYANFMYSFMPEYKRQKQAGTLKPNALDMSDPNSLISQQMKQFKPTEEQKMRYHVMKNLGTDPSNIQSFNPAGKSAATPAAPTVTTKEQFGALKSGQTYVGTDGRKYRKP